MIPVVLSQTKTRPTPPDVGLEKFILKATQEMWQYRGHNSDQSWTGILRYRWWRRLPCIKYYTILNVLRWRAFYRRRTAIGFSGACHSRSVRSSSCDMVVGITQQIAYENAKEEGGVICSDLQSERPYYRRDPGYKGNDVSTWLRFPVVLF